jgi:hypothetical protein
MAKQSQYIGLASIFLPFLGFATAVIAVLLGHAALKKIKRSNGALTGQESATMGLYFGYITMALIVVYSTVFFVLFSPTSTAPLANTQIAPPGVPLILTPSSHDTPTAPPAVSSASHDSPASAPSTPTPPVAAPATPDPASAAPTISANTQDAPTPVSAPESLHTPPAPAPETPAVTILPDAPKVTPPASLVTLHDPALDQPAPTSPPSPTPVPKVPTPPTLMSLMDTSEGLHTTPPSFSAEPDKPLPAAPDRPAAVYSPEVQNRLKDGMLSQPIPDDTSSRPYLDAEAFNNAARILAREPEAKYAESVGDFLEEVKKRNPDPVRLQILTAMYDNYLAALREPQ